MEKTNRQVRQLVASTLASIGEFHLKNMKYYGNSDKLDEVTQYYLEDVQKILSLLDKPNLALLLTDDWVLIREMAEQYGQITKEVQAELPQTNDVR